MIILITGLVTFFSLEYSLVLLSKYTLMTELSFKVILTLSVNNKICWQGLNFNVYR
mgnify:CR=1 FL=1